MKLVQLTDDQMIIFEKTGKITNENFFYDVFTDFLYISLRKKMYHEYFTNRIDIHNKITLFYENNGIENSIDNLTNQLTSWSLGTNVDTDNFLGQCYKRYNGLQIRNVSKLININQWNLPFIEIHEFPYIDDNTQCMYILINFIEEDPFNYSEDNYEKINEEIGILWGENSKIKQITIKTS